MAESATPGVYRRRRPEKSVLYRALAQHFEEFLRLYEERFEHTFGYLRGCIQQAVYRYLDLLRALRGETAYRSRRRR